MNYPIFSNSDGRTVIGHAQGVRSATVALRRILTIHKGFNLYVWKRPKMMQDILNLPDGFCYSISSGLSK